MQLFSCLPKVDHQLMQKAYFVSKSKRFEVMSEIQPINFTDICI